MIAAAFLVLAAQVGAQIDAGPRPIEAPVDVDAGVADASADASADAGPRDTPGFTLSARLDPDPVPFGAPVDLVVTIVRPPKKRLELPKDIEPAAPLPRVGEVQRTAKEVGDKVQETLRFRFLALDVKELKTPAFVIKSDDVAGRGEGVALLEVPSLPVRVTTSPLPEELHDAGPDGKGALGPGVLIESAAETMTWRVRDDRPWQALVAAVVLVAGFFFVRGLIAASKKKQQAKGPPPPPPRPAWQVAIERLDALMPLLQRGEVTTFVEKMMDEVLRDYLAGRFALNAGTRTTKEIVVDLLGVVSKDLDVALVEEVGKDADLVKFARANLPAATAHAMAGRVRALILATADTPPPAPGGERP